MYLCMVNSNYRHMEKLPESNSNRWPRPVQMRGETPRTGLLALRRGCRCIAFLAACCFGLTATAQNPSSYVPTKGEIFFNLYQSSEGKPIHTRPSNPFTSHRRANQFYIDLDNAQVMQTYDGLGISLTDASCWHLSQLPQARRDSLLRMVFTADGLNMSMIRLNCGSSDYATQPYNYDDHAGDERMRHFSIGRDAIYMIPVIREVQRLRPDIFTFSSMWSAPGWMKDSGLMYGGSLLDRWLPAFANYWASYLNAYRAAGVRVDAITVQNEPMTDQQGLSVATLVSAAQEAKLISRLLPDAFARYGLTPQIWMLDHDYDYADRVLQTLAAPGVLEHTGAVAWHPYTGNAREILAVRERYPDLKFHLTERGPAINERDVRDEKWWTDMVFDAFNCGCSSFSGWNLLLDENGTPNIGPFGCGGLVTVDSSTGALTPDCMWTVLRHIGPYVSRGARVLDITPTQAEHWVRMAGEKDAHMRKYNVLAFRNPDGSHVIVIGGGHYKWPRQVNVKYRDQYMTVQLPMGTWSLTTIVIPAAGDMAS